ncbi:unnamed protein product [Merluccius merluccius]
MVHLLHVEMVTLVREPLSKFLKPGVIPLSIDEILKVNVRETASQLSNKNLCFGRFAFSSMTKGPCGEEGKAWPNVVQPEALGQLQEEVRAYQIDVDLLPLAKTNVEDNSRVDVDWWSRVALLKTTERGVSLLCISLNSLYKKEVF